LIGLQNFWNAGRVLATQQYIGQHIITVISLYGLPRGPTWPRAPALTNSILEFVGKEFVLGYQGIVLIVGDFNFSPHELSSFDAWRAAGYCSAQALAALRWNQPILPTCKGATERDQIWMSPMAASLCAEVLVTDVFHDHASVAARLNIENAKPKILSWPRSTQIPWDEIQIADWQLHCEDVTFPPLTEATQTMRSFAISFEGSLDGFVQDYPRGNLCQLHTVGVRNGLDLPT
jgi:hypothetical protein